MNCNYKVKITDIQTKYKFKVFCTGYDDSEIKEKIDTMYEAWPKASGEGETPTLDNTANATMSIDLKGNTSQETTTGKNIWNLGSLSGTTQAGITLTKDTDGEFLLNGTSTGVGRFKIALNTDINETITLYLKSSNNSGDIMISLRDANDAQLISMRNDNVLKVYSYTPTAPVRYIELIQLTSGVQYTNYEIYPMIVKGSYTSSTIGDYEPYTNGASPNPDYPQDVHVVTGDNTINICGKNLFDYNNQTIKEGYAKDGSGTEIASAGSNYTTSYTPVKPNTTYTFSFNLSAVVCRIYFYNSNKTWIDRTDNIINSSNKYTFTTPNNCYYLQFQNVINFATGNIQLELGNQATDYAPYQSQSYAVNLGSMELCKIGTYQDSIVKDNGKWYLNKQIGKVILNGSETGWVALTPGVWGTNGYGVTNAISNFKQWGRLFSDYFKDANISSARILNNGEMVITAGAICLKNDNTTTLEDFKTWLNSNNVEVRYVLATPTTTEITDATLISQLNALPGAESYTGQTNISQTNDDKPFILTAKALKDLSNL